MYHKSVAEAGTGVAVNAVATEFWHKVIVGLLTVGEGGAGITVIEEEAVLLHPLPSVPVTV